MKAALKLFGFQCHVIYVQTLCEVFLMKNLRMKTNLLKYILNLIFNFFENYSSLIVPLGSIR